MKEYTIRIKTESDTMPGSGQSVPGILDSDIKYDAYGLPYMNAKTMKGHISEQMRLICKMYPQQFQDVSLSELLGSPDTEGSKRNGRLRFSVMKLSAGISAGLRQAVDAGTVTREEILDSLTVTYAFTSLDEEGIAKEHSLRRVRMVKKGLPFETTVYSDTLSGEEERLLVYSVLALQHIGTYKSKGKGLVKCEILDGNVNLGEKYLKEA